MTDTTVTPEIRSLGSFPTGGGPDGDFAIQEPQMNKTEITNFIAAVRPFSSDTLMLCLRNVIERHYGRLQAATDRRIARQRWLASIREQAENGMIALCVWSRDCDNCEGTHRYEVEAVPAVIDALVEEILDGAEGPTRFWLQALSSPFESTHRDRNLKAFENGHPYRV